MKIHHRLSAILTLGFIAFLGMQSLAFAASKEEAGRYVQTLGDNALAIISDSAASKEQKQVGLEKLFSQSVDFPWVGRFVMGHFWREATDDQKTRYIQAYERFLILHYTSRFTDYSSGTFKVLDVKDDGSDEFTVGMRIQSNDSHTDPVLVNYRIRKEEGSFKIFDVIVEGVSLLTTQRSEFSSVITNNGIDYLINQLAVKSKTGAL